MPRACVFNLNEYTGMNKRQPGTKKPRTIGRGPDAVEGRNGEVRGNGALEYWGAGMWRLRAMGKVRLRADGTPILQHPGTPIPQTMLDVMNDASANVQSYSDQRQPVSKGGPGAAQLRGRLRASASAPLLQFAVQERVEVHELRAG